MSLRSVASPRRRLGALAILLLTLIAAPVIAETLPVPALTGRVVDQAGILNNSEEARLVAKLANLEAKSSTQLVVVTLSSLRGSPIEDWGLALGRTWGIGQKGKDNGVLLIVAPNDRQVRIEVGYGLEGTLPDATADAIIRNVIVPRFKAGSMAGGISDGVDSIIAALGGSGAEFIASGNQNFERTVRTLIPFLFAGLFVVIVLVRQRLGPSRQRGYRYYRYSNGGWVTYDNDRHSGGGWGGGGGFGGGGGGFSGGGGSFGGGGASGRW